MPTAVIADDEPLLRDELRDTLSELWPELTIVAEAGDGAAALKLIREHTPDVAFLDIRMPRMTGLEVAEAIAGGSTLAVFATAHDEHALSAFEQGAVDYIVKPIKHARVAKTIDRLKARLTANGAAAEGSAPAPGGQLKFIQASVGNQVRIFAIDDVMFLQSDSKYTRVVTPQAEALVRTALSELESKLDPEQFWRIHRSTVVNIRFIESVVRGEGLDPTVVKLKGRADTLEVSRTHQSRFRGM